MATAHSLLLTTDHLPLLTTHYYPLLLTTHYPKVCDLGGYCPRGASLVRSCLEGTFGNVTRLKTREDCHDCWPGTECALGSIEPRDCSAGATCHLEYSLLTTHCSLLTAHCSLLTAYC